MSAPPKIGQLEVSEIDNFKWSFRFNQEIIRILRTGKFKFSELTFTEHPVI